MKLSKRSSVQRNGVVQGGQLHILERRLEQGNQSHNINNDNDNKNNNNNNNNNKEYYRSWGLVWCQRYVERVGGGEGGSDDELLSVVRQVLHPGRLFGQEKYK